MSEELATIRAIGTAGVPWAVLILAVVAFIKVLPALRKIGMERDASLRAELMARIAKLEAKLESAETQNAAQRIECDERIERLEARNSHKLDALEAEVRVLRHEKNNQAQSFEALLLLLKQDPNKVRESILAIEEMRARQSQSIAQEKGAILAPNGRQP